MAKTEKTMRWLALMLIFAFSFEEAKINMVAARDDGRYAGSPLKPWFDSLHSKSGPCCSDADGTAVSDVDWDTVNGHYRVRLQNHWIDVPDDAVITEPNRVGRTIVWPYYVNGTPIIRCFMPGALI